MNYPWSTSLKVTCSVVDVKPGFHPVEYGSYVRADIECVLEKSGHADFVGEICAEKICVQDARRDGFHLRDVLSERGCGILSNTLFTDKEEIKPKFKVAPDWVDLQVITCMEIDRKYRTESVVVRSIQSFIGFAGARDLVAVLLFSPRNGGVRLSPKELELLGFKRIAGTTVAIRDPSKIRPNASVRRSRASRRRKSDVDPQKNGR